jgi:DNA-binding NarL/FixJ family response regulator
MNHSATNRPNILVMHEDPLLSAGLVAALRQHVAFEVFVSDIDTASSDEPRIDVVIADYCHAMRLIDPAVRAAHRPLAAARIMALTSNDREADIRRAIEAGIHGYLLLGGPLSELIEGVTTVANGVRYLGRSVAQRMADSLTRTSLTSRETEVLRLVMTGESNKAIARRLNIELGTVKSHMTAIMTKLGATSRTQAAGIASARGLVEERVLERPAPPASPASPASRASPIAPGMQLA